MTRPNASPLDAIIARHGDVQVLPVSFAQQRFWMLDQIDGAGAYTIPLALRLTGVLDVGALQRAFQHVVDRHEALRTVFAMDGDEPVQVVLPRVEVALPVEDVAGLAPDAREMLVAERAFENANASFDLGTGPLLRTSLLRLGDEEHVLLVALHHVIADGWSVGVLFDELGAAYGALARGDTPPLPPLPLQYADYAVWQRRVVQGKKGQEQLAYWAAQLRDVPTLELETDRARPPEQTANGGKRERIVVAAVAEGMRALARRERATPYMAFLAAFATLLHRYTGQSDVVIGSITSGRLRPEVEPLIGLFVNTLAIRAHVAGDPSFVELLQRVRERASKAYANQDVPFEQVVEAVQPARDRSRSPIFQAAFQLLEGLAGELALPGLVTTRVPGAKDTTKFELTLMLHPTRDGGLRAVIEYNSDLFDAATIDAMLEHYATLLDGIVADPTCAVSRLPLMTDAERALLLVERNATTTAVPDALLHELIFEQCRRTPASIAVEADGDGGEVASLTFAELARGANAVARQLRALGVRRGDAVGIALERSCDLMIALVGTLAAGAHYVPLDLDLPPERLGMMVDESRPAVILATAPDVERMRAIAGAAAVLDVASIDRDVHGEAPPDLDVDSRDSSSLAYTIYTSGSTGRPKGVMIPHRAVVNYLCWMRSAYPVGTDDAVLQKAPVSFDASIWELFLPLVTGARLVLARPGGHRDAAYLADVVRRRGVTLLQLVPSQVAMMLEEGTLRACTQLRRIVCGGEALPSALLESLVAAMPHVAVTNLYGPTETTVYSTHWDLDRATFDGTVPIGRPIWNTSVYVVDATMQPVPAGVPGELLIGGRGVALGYAGRPELTRERFVALPVAGDMLVYRTGDRVRWRRDGMLEYLGRGDTQVKLRGYRIELDEIEWTLAQHPTVAAAAAMVREDAPGDRRLVAYVTASGAMAPDPAALRDSVRARLPKYMVPSAIVVLDALPVNANGKLDRRALPAPGANASDDAAATTLPRTPLAEQIAAIWRDVLGRDVIGVHDDFFALGGHSLLAMRVVARIAMSTGAALTIGAMFRARTIAGLTVLVEAQTAARGAEPAARTAALAAHPRSRHDAGVPLPLSPSQELLWLYEQAAPGNAAYNVPIARRVRGAVDVRALDAAFTAVVAAHEALRTTFTEIDGSARQVVGAPWDVSTHVVDLQGVPAGERDDRALATIRALASGPIDVSGGPLLRVHLIRLAPAEHILLVVVHHLVFDGASIPVLLGAVAGAYESFLQSGVARCEPPACQVAELAARERADVAAGDALEFWREYLRGSSTLIDLPLDGVRGGDDLRGARFAQTLTPALRDAVSDAARRLGVTPFIVLLAAFDVLLYRFSGQSDLVVGTPMAGRASADASGVIGHLTSTVPIRARLDAGPTFADVARDLAADAARVYEHATVPFAQLERTTAAGSVGLFDVLFNLQDGAAPIARLGDAALEPIGAELAAAKLPLSVSVALTPAGIRVVAEYRTALFHEATVAGMMRCFATLLESAAASPDRPVDQLDMLAAADRDELIRMAGRGATPVETAADPVPAMILQQCARKPGAVALIATGADDRRIEITYAELAARSAALAAQLATLGVAPGDAVAVCVDRSADLVVALLASWRVGAHYVPIDPEYPADRIGFMIRDSAARVIITDPSSVGRLPDPGSDQVPQHVLVLAAGHAGDASSWTDDAPPSPDALAYVIYTSGSTGQPKGVMVQHAALANLVRSMAQEPGIGAGDVLAAVTTISFDIAALELWVPLCVGGTVVLALREEAADGERLVQLLQRERVSVLQATPVTWRLLLAAGWRGDPALLMMCGGEALPPDLASALLPRGRALWNMYGPTETTIWSALARVRPGEPISLGHPVANTQLHVVERQPDGTPDTAIRLAPIGVPGELLIGGAGVARGYHERPELTASRFLPDAITGSPGARLYRTGDLVRRHADGRLEFLGRLDQQVKLRGFRIELGEIESALRAAPGVGDAAVALHDLAAGTPSLTAYVSLDGSATVTPHELHAVLRATLPVYMLPSHLVMLEELPRTANGKLDRRALRAPLPNEMLAAAAYVPPASAVEHVIAALFAEVLGMPGPSVDASFFLLGGHSLLATRVVALASRIFRRSVTHRTLFEHPSARAFARVLTDSEPVPGQTQKIAELFLRAQQSQSAAAHGGTALTPA